MKRILIVFHSKTGGARQMAEAAARGAASEPQCRVNLIHASEAGPAELLESDGYVFATPENLAMMSGIMKDFFDRTYYPVLDRIVGRPYAALICAGSDGENAARQIQRIAAGWRLKKIAETVIVRRNPGGDPRAQKNRCTRLEALRRGRRNPGCGSGPRNLLSLDLAHRARSGTNRLTSLVGPIAAQSQSPV